ncbi:O-methyltransferase, family 3 [Rubrobacter xylanophilus DSM 9941]|uniref:O-methyltransferase, family 3 n=1 Tax=Rubrobacter xylanophilus (strain DSM 9941 / JCM 11954 / NBRC 16129 / PRD-1) TaxID=266117 RepID=Q1AU62_RUBXD|nr:O-methyltransferase [Rubrobacter xylanophilus]ABG05066.1 O-methyltransferase, family 3 [Rubrobacter xylanophilus DSM 9941]
MDAGLLRRVEDYIEALFAPPDPALEAALEESRRAGLPEIQISPNQGRILQLLAALAGARRALEIGTLGGYSAIHLARALPEDGSLVSLEIEERHAEVARRNIERAGLGGRVEVRVGEARGLLSEMIRRGEGPFDAVFIDADKRGYPDYLELSLRLSRPGTLILADNLIRGGDVLEPRDEAACAVSRFNEMLARDRRLDATIVPLLRERLDGFAVARVTGL